MKVYLDIETIPDESLRGPIMSGEIVLPKDPREREGEDSAVPFSEERFRTLTLLGGAFCKLLCIGLVVEQNGLVTHRGLFGRERRTRRFHLDEARTLSQFWNFLKGLGFDERAGHLVIGYNVLDYDWPVILQRSIATCTKPSIKLSLARYRSSPIFDVMWEFSCWRRRIGLNNLCRVLKVESPKAARGEGDDAMDGSHVYERYLAGDHERIAEYCLADVEATRRLYYRLQYSQPPEDYTEQKAGAPLNPSVDA